jgi:predicted DNA-binding transcriptional regulator AlpA
MFIREGVKLLEETEGDGEVVQRQREYILSIRFTLNRGEVITLPPLSFRPELGQKMHDDGFFEHRTRINRDWLIPGLFYAVQGMRIGGYRKVDISPHLAYGERGVQDTIPPNAKLTAEIKVLSEVVRPRRQRYETELAESEALTQDDLCARYGTTRLTLWRWRKAGRLPAAVIVGRTARWRRSTIEQWEAEGRPQVSPSLDEAQERWDQVFVRLKALSLASRESPNGGFVGLTPEEQEELKQLVQEIDQHDERFSDVPIELVLLMDEAGQWNGVPVEKLLNEDRADGFSRVLMDALQKVLAHTE